MSPALMVSYSGSLGGAERVLLDFAQALEEPCLACPEGPLASSARAAGIRVWALPARSTALRGDRRGALARLAAHRRELRGLVRDLEPSLVIANGTRSAIALLWPPAVPGAPPVVFLQHDMLPGPALGAIVRAAARRAALVVVPSRAVADDLGPRVPAVVVHPGVETRRFDLQAEPAQPPVVLVLGAIVGWKQPQLALETLALVRRLRPEVRLRLVGAPIDADGERLLEALRDRAAQPDLAGAVEFPGAVADPAPELARASCLLHCAPREPFGMVLLEALAAGRPVVAPASAGPQEILADAAGRLYPPGDAAAAAERVLQALEPPEQRIVLPERFRLPAARARFTAAVAPLVPARPPRAATPLALVTVTHNSARELEALLGSAGRQLPGVPVIVVDNASDDDTVAVARAAANATLVELPDNLGFGAASNVGVQAAGEPVTALVNPDVELLDDSLLELAAEAARADRLLAPLVLSSDGSRQDTVHPLPTSVPELLSALIPQRVLPGFGGAAPWRAAGPRRVGWAVGCAVVARTETLRRLGPFDERTFLYGEDLELGLRAGAAGIETWFWPSARVLHTGGHSTSQAFAGEPFELLAQARHDAVARGLGSRRARLDDRVQALTFRSRIVLKSALRLDAERERRQLAAMRRLFASRLVIARVAAMSALVVAIVIVVAATSGQSGSPVQYGANVNWLFDDPAYTPAQIAAQLSALRATGATLARSDALWEATEPFAPSDGVHQFHWVFDDRIASALARHGLRWLPIIDYSAPWAESVPGNDHSGPSSAGAYAAYAGALAARYGAGGTFWRSHPGLQQLPVQLFEVWNEPDNPAFWSPRPNPVGYARLYAAARVSILAADPSAHVLVGGLTLPAAFLPALLAALPSLHGRIDGVAIHPYGVNPGVVMANVRAARSALDALGLGPVPLYVTEFGWTTQPAGALDWAPAAARPGYIENTLGALGRSGCGIDAVTLYTWTTPDLNPRNSQQWYGISPPGAGAGTDVRGFTAGLAAARRSSAGGSC